MYFLHFNITRRDSLKYGIRSSALAEVFLLVALASKSAVGSHSLLSNRYVLDKAVEA
jgi:hypothetical protein